MIHISYSSCGFTHYNERIKVSRISISSYRKFDIIGACGVIKKYSSGKYGVLLNGMRNPASREGLFWIKGNDFKFIEDESEDVNMTGFKNVAIVNLLDDYNKKDYGFALYNNELEMIVSMVHTPVMVVVNARGKDHRVLGTVKEIMTVEEYGKGVTAQVVGVVNMDSYLTRVEEEKRLKELAKKKAAIEKELEAEINKRKSVEYYEEMAKKYSDNPKLAELVAELKGLGD